MSALRGREADSDRAPVTGCLVVLRRCAGVLEAIADADVVASRRRLAVAGPHLRHVVDHFDAFLTAVTTAPGAGSGSARVDYPARRRDPQLERDPAALHAALARLEAMLEGLDAHDLPRALVVNDVAAPGESCESASSVGRELVFLSSHAVHHLALVATLLRPLGCEVSEATVLAFSTAAHRAAPEAGGGFA